MFYAIASIPFWTIAALLFIWAMGGTYFINKQANKGELGQLLFGIFLALCGSGLFAIFAAWLVT